MSLLEVIWVTIFCMPTPHGQLPTSANRAGVHTGDSGAASSPLAAASSPWTEPDGRS